MISEKTCRGCGKIKPVEMFGVNRGVKDGYFGTCRDCRNARARARYSDDADAFREATRWRMIKHRYGLTKADWEALYDSQDGKCAICGGELPVDIKTRPNVRATTCIDHDHETGIVRGLLCQSCNLGIGMLKHDESLMLSAIAYLKRWDEE